MTSNNQLTTKPVPLLIRQIAVPASVGFFFNTMFNVVDTYFGGTISTQVLAALSLSFPVFFIIIALGTGFSTGLTALIATAFGAGNRGQAKILAIQGITFGVLMAVIITFLGLYASPSLFRLLGASDDYLITCLNYMNIIFLGTIFFMLGYMFNSILNALGDTKSFRNFLIVGFFLNIILAPWFIYGGLGIPPLKIFGIALATVLIQVFGSIYLFIRVSKTGLIADKKLKDLLPDVRLFAEIARQGFPASLNMITVGLGIFVITYFLSKFGKEAVAAYGIATRVEQIVLLPTIGLNIATLTIVAQNHGAKFFDRIEQAVKTALRYGVFLMTIGTMAVFIFARLLMGLFTDDGCVIQFGAQYLRIAAFVLNAYVILYINVAALQGLKKPMFAVWIGLYRQIAAPIVLFYLLVNILSFGLVSIYWGIFSITWSAALITIYYAHRHLAR